MNQATYEIADNDSTEEVCMKFHHTCRVPTLLSSLIALV